MEAGPLTTTLPPGRGREVGGKSVYSFAPTQAGFADVAQLAEQLPCKQQVKGSSPFVSFRVSGCERGKKRRRPVAACDSQHYLSMLVSNRPPRGVLVGDVAHRWGTEAVNRGRL